MDTEFINKLKYKLSEELPGEFAHAKMSPLNRIKINELQSQGIVPRESAVMIVLYPLNKNWTILLIKRNEYSGTHSAQVAFPGGRKDDDDPSFLATAIREAREETGVEVDESNVIGKLTPIYIPPSNFMVHPYVTWFSTRPELKPDPREVNYIIEFPVKRILDDSIIKFTMIETSGGLRMNVPYFDINNEIVWGATAIILSELKELLKEIEF